MNIKPILYKTLLELNKAMKGSLQGTKIETIGDTINAYAIAAAVASFASGALPGVAGVVAALTQAGFVWATYIKINQTLGISMSEHTAKFIGTAIVTNLVASGGAALLAYAAAFILAWIPIANFLSGFVSASLGYMVVYSSAVIYLQLITKFVQPDGSVSIPESESTKKIVKDLIGQSKMDDIFQEGRDAFKKAKADGSFDRARKQKKCPRCPADVKPGQRFCSECGAKLF